MSANGNSNSFTAGLGGLHLGYNGNAIPFGKNAWHFIPAAEIEGFYLATTPKAQLINITHRVPGHTFNDSFPMNTGVFLANVILTFKQAQTNTLYPYLGGGIGGAVIFVSGANASQINPQEPGINHFNSSSSARSNAFAAQAKVGLGYDISAHFKLFGEYRYLYLAPTNYTFGSTQYPTHVATTNWDVHVGSMNYNLGVVGIKYLF